jgi:hypothetical protein
VLTLLLWLSPFVAIAIVVWNYRRQAAAREAASNERFKELISKTTAKDAGESTLAAPGFDAPVLPAPPVQPSMNFAVRERMLTAPQTLLYYLLKSNLSDHEVLAQVSAVTIVDVPSAVIGFERETRLRRLAAAVVDFVVCDKSFRAVAVVQCGTCAGIAAETLAFARACCESAGLRWVEIAPNALPRRETVRSVVLGA